MTDGRHYFAEAPDVDRLRAEHVHSLARALIPELLVVQMRRQEYVEGLSQGRQAAPV